MTTLVARTGPLESRAIQSLLRPGDRKRPWVCCQCQARKFSRQSITPASQETSRRDSRAKATWKIPSGVRYITVDTRSRRNQSQYVAANGAALDPSDLEGHDWAEQEDQEDNGYAQSVVDSVEDEIAGQGKSGMKRGDGTAASSISSSFFTGDALDVQARGDALSAAVAASEANVKATRVQDALSELDVEAPTKAYEPSRTEKRALAQVQRALQQGYTDGLLKAVINAGNRDAVWDSISEQDFSAMLDLVCSDAHVRDIIDKHSRVTSAQGRDMRITPLQDVIGHYLRAVTDIARMRRQTRHKLTAVDYGKLLSACHTTGNEKVAQVIWRWMESDEVKPNTQCFQNLLGAYVWNDLLPEYRVKRRVDSFNLTARENPYAGKPYNNYKVGEGGIKELTAEIFGKMLKSEVQADEETICHVLIGMAREGDTTGMQKLMARVWDIQAVRIFRDDDTAPKIAFASDSPLQPTSHLLGTLAFCYSINGAVPTGLRLIDYVSRHFGIAVKKDVWETLLHWAYVLSRPKSGKRPKSPLDNNAIPRVWRAMRSEPYNVQPNVAMYDYRVRAHHTARRPYDTLLAMDEAMDEFMTESEAYKQTWKTLYTQLEKDPDASKVEMLQKDIDQAGLALNRHSSMMKGWTKLLLSLMRDSDRDDLWKMTMITVPSLFRERWSHWLPQNVEYFTPTGHVKIHKMSDQEVLEEHHRKRTTAYRRKVMLDESRRVLGHDWVHQRFDNKRMRLALQEEDELN